jgi:putative hydrolase of the HAD superfamily
LIRALSVDLWGTLIEDEPGPLETYTQMRLQALWSVLSKYISVDYDAVVEVYKRVSKYKGFTPPRDFAKIITLAFGVTSESILEEAGEAYEQSTYTYTPRVIPGARELLEYAKSIGLRVVVATNTSFSATGVLKMLRNAGLGDYVDYVASSADLGVEKPNPEIFRAALRAVGVKPSEAIHIGDSCGRDVFGSLLAGLKPVLYAEKRDVPDLCRTLRIPVVKSLREAISVLEALVKRSPPAKT